VDPSGLSHREILAVLAVNVGCGSDGLKRMSPVVIACAADNRYALPLAVMLRSVAANLSPRYRLEVFAVDDGIGPSEKAKVLDSLTERVTLHWVQPRASGFAGLPLWGRMPITTYQKLTLAEWLPPEVVKAIWLDCDVLAIGDIAALWDADLSGRHALAVQDERVLRVSSRFGVAAYRELGLPPDAKYFNAGVLVIDVSQWRKDDVAACALRYLKTYRDRVFFWDQEALNAVLANQWGELDSGWNRHPTVREFVAGPKRGGGARHCATEMRIVHFSGNLKPWNGGRSSPHHGLYFHYVDQTAWTGWRPSTNWKSMLLGAYESSRLRRLLYPAEQWRTRAIKRLTRRYQLREGE
jgi:lipopolysaccharide biosynthesis glycosyltransferase